jgi:hypothetical protein
MDQPFIPDDIVQFVIDKVDSVAELEALLLLRSHPDHRWTPQELSKRLYLSDKDGFEILVALSTKGLALYKASGSGCYEYRPGLVEVAQLVDRLCDIYSKQIVAITHLIHSKSKTKVQKFADAFNLRKKDE